MVSSKAILAGFGVLATSLLQPCLAIPFSSNATSAQVTPSYDNALFRRAEPQDFYLRIMPLGASITAGEHEPDDDKGKNGYRKYLRDKLRSEGWKVNMVGNFNRGNMKDSVSYTPHVPGRLEQFRLTRWDRTTKACPATA